MKKTLLLASTFALVLFSSSTSAMAQKTVPLTFFGVTTSDCTPTNSHVADTGCYETTGTHPQYPVWWPNSSSGSSPAITVGAEGKGIQTAWSYMENNPACLTHHSDGSTYGFFQYDGTALGCNGIDYSNLDSYVTAAQSSSVDTIYTFFQVPQWAVCYPYGSGNGGNGYGGPVGTGKPGISCSTAISSSSCNNPTPEGTGWCPGPELDTNFGNITWFAKQLVDHYCEYPNTCSTSASNTIAINYWEIWNEPDATGYPYWIQSSGSNSPDYTTLIEQTSALESAISSEYTTKDAGTPTFIGPAFASRGINATSGYNDALSSMCGSTCSGDSSWSTTGFLNTCPTIGGVSVCGSSLVSTPTFHMYPTYDVGAGGYTPSCSYAPPAGTVSPVKCTGSNLISNITTRLGAFSTYGSLAHAFMTEGGWMNNCNFASSCTSYTVTSGELQDMRAYIARYTLLSASTIWAPPGPSSAKLDRQYWFSWTGGIATPNGSGGFGVLCDNGLAGTGTLATNYPCLTKTSRAYYGGFAYGQVINWLSSASSSGSIATSCTAYTIAGVTGCSDTTGSLWVYQVEEPGHSSPNAIVAWVWDNTSIVCPGALGCTALSLSTYSDYKTLEGSTVTMGSGGVTFGEEPILIEK